MQQVFQSVKSVAAAWTPGSSSLLKRSGAPAAFPRSDACARILTRARRLVSPARKPEGSYKYTRETTPSCSSEGAHCFFGWSRLSTHPDIQHPHATGGGKGAEAGAAAELHASSHLRQHLDHSQASPHRFCCNRC